MKTEQVDYLTDKNVMYLTNSLEFKKTGIIENKDFYLLKITYLGSYCPSSNELTVMSFKGWTI